MSTIVIEVPPEVYRKLEERARRAGKDPHEFARSVLESTLRTGEPTPTPMSQTRDVLEAAGRVRPLSESLRRKIIPGVTLDEVRASLSQAAGPSLSEIISEHRGPKT